jgi:hypothetical protein
MAKAAFGRSLILAMAGLFALCACASTGESRAEACSSDDWYRSQRPYCDPAMPREEAERQQAIEETLRNAREALEEARQDNAAESHLF